MKVPFGTINIFDKSKKLINEILDSGRVSGGKYVREFEKMFAEVIGTKEAVAVANGTDAIAMALASLYDFGAERGDEVIVPALSFVSTGIAPLQAGFKPVFVDIERETLNIDPGKIEGKITTRTRAINPVHLMGKPAEMDKILEIAEKHKLAVIEDAAEAHGGKYKGRNLGGIGIMGTFSLYVAHIVSTLEGGIITTDSSEYAEILRSLRAHGRGCKCNVCVVNTKDGYCPVRFKYGSDIRFIFERVGFSSKMNELEAAIGLGSIEHYDEIVQKRRENFFYLQKKIQKFNPILATINLQDYEDLGPHAFPIVIGEEAKFSRDDFVVYLEKNGVDSRHLFASMPTQCRAFEFMKYRLGDFPNAEYIGNNGLHIGVHQDLDRDALDYFIKVVEDFLCSG